ARRYLHVFGPTTPAAFGGWAGIAPVRARAAFDALAPSLTPVRTPVGDAWILAGDEPAFRSSAGSPAAARLLPSGDAYFLLQGVDRELLVPDAARRGELWTPRVWPGAVLVAGEIVGTWRRANANLTIQRWRRLSRPEREAVEAEAESLPLAGLEGRIAVRWTNGA
ncbi:MAG TPA: crosslink repair DNA glycosylase YcaQ family protein, partial [Candidatus Limnocylindrales bacterium]|nr:crosslink repair DNA glycosylase YcaQ family protein [Candidatus Limnocylindrales bacterium]